MSKEILIALLDLLAALLTALPLLETLPGFLWRSGCLYWTLGLSSIPQLLAVSIAHKAAFAAAISW